MLPIFKSMRTSHLIVSHASPLPRAVCCSNVANTAITRATPPKTAAQIQKEQLAATAKNLKNQILQRQQGSNGSGGGSATASGALATASSSSSSSGLGGGHGKREVKTLDEYLAGVVCASSCRRAGGQEQRVECGMESVCRGCGSLLGSTLTACGTFCVFL